MREVPFIYSDNLLKYLLSPSHPFNPKRWKIVYQMYKFTTEAYPDLPTKLVEPRIAKREEIELVHDPAYVSFVEEKSRQGFGFLDYGDTPVSFTLYEGARYSYGGSLTAVDLIKEGASIVVSIGGGLHHARRDRAAGFCVFNDVAGAAKYAQKLGFKKVAIVDIDAHHGDGTQYILGSDPTTLKISFHESGRYLYPGTGFPDEIGIGDGKGFTINFPYLPSATDSDFILAFDKIVPTALREFKPDLILVQSGVDSHKRDPLTHVQFSNNVHIHAASQLIDLAKNLSGGRIAFLGGGGYNYEVVSRTWVYFLALASDFEMEKVPKDWAGYISNFGFVANETYRDKQPQPTKIARAHIETLKELKENVPLLSEMEI